MKYAIAIRDPLTKKLDHHVFFSTIKHQIFAYKILSQLCKKRDIDLVMTKVKK